jgi:phenylphosphate carboxylase beta subunit
VIKKEDTMKSMGDWIAACEKEGEIHRIKAEVDWDLEMLHIARLNESKKGPALLFENVKGYDIPVLASAFTTPKRLAITLGLPTNYTMCQLSRSWMEKTSKGSLVKPVEVKDNIPVKEQIIESDKVNVLDFPVPRLYPLDGGRYIGTTSYLVTQDPETGWTNLGTYRKQVLDEKSVGIQILPGKHAEFHLKKYQKMGKKVPAAAVIGCDPLHFIVSSTMVSAEVDEYDVIGALRGEPVEIFKSDFTGLKLPANAEAILEGEIDPEDLRPEGPFGEYTGYYSGKSKWGLPKYWLNVKRILRRKKPTYHMTSVGPPVGEHHMIQSLNRTGTLWSDLEAMHIPGIQSVYCPYEATGRFWVIVSIKTMYPGHANQVGHAVIATTTGHYGVKGVIVVDDDISADDLTGVWWSLAVRYNAVQDTDIVRRARSTVLDPSLPIDAREIVSQIIMDATIPYEWKEKPIKVVLDEKMKERVISRWQEYGFPEPY